MELLDFNTSGKKATEGVWVPMGADGSLRIARMDNPKYKAFIQEARKQRGRRAPSDEETRELLKKAVAKTVLLDWKGVTLNGEKVKYSPAYAERVFDALPGLLDQVVNIAYDETLFREDEIDDVVEQLRPTSAGALSGAAKSSSSKK
jgi:hypothetical protein